MNSRTRSRKGSTIAEAGPALFLLIIMLFYPMLNIIGLGLAYYSGFMLNTWQTREAALINANEAQDPSGAICHTLPEHWRTNGLGTFANIKEGIDTQVSYEDGTPDAVLKADKIVRVTTTVKYNPWFTVPFFKVPGLGEAFPITFSNTRHVEDPDLVANAGAKLMPASAISMNAR